MRARRCGTRVVALPSFTKHEDTEVVGDEHAIRGEHQTPLRLIYCSGDESIKIKFSMHLSATTTRTHIF